MYALFEGDRQIGTPFATEKEVWEAALIEGLVTDVPVADEEGAGEMITVWKDPEFDPALRAFYYVRVIEIPTPRWTAYDAKRFGTKPLDGTTMTVTERAYTSPIWYSPER